MVFTTWFSNDGSIKETTMFGFSILRGSTITRESNTVEKMLHSMFLKGASSGKQTSGLALATYNEISVLKRNLASSAFTDIPEYTDLIRTRLHGDEIVTSIIGCHSNFGQLNEVDRSPLIRGGRVGSVSGKISNADGLFNVFSKTFNRNGKVPEEIVFALLEQFNKKAENTAETITRAARSLVGKFLVAMIDSGDPHLLWLFRKEEPCTVVLFKKAGLLMWAVNKTHLTETTSFFEDIGPGEEVEFAPNTGLGIDMHRHKIHRFKIDNEY